MTPCETMYLICEGSAKAPEVALEIAQHASFLVLKSAFWRMLMRGGTMLLHSSQHKIFLWEALTYASMTAWI